MNMFLAAVAYHPTRANQDLGDESYICVPLTLLLAKDDQDAAFKAGQLVADHLKADPQRLHVAVVPFQQLPF